MDYPLLANDEVRTEYFSKKIGEKSACIFQKCDDHWYILAKSLVKSVVEGHYVCGEDPYIQNLLKLPRRT